jgi:hypothetical protein
MVRLRNSVILSGPPAKFIKFHEPVALADLPEKFHSLIIDESKSPEPSGPPDSRFFLNTPYHVRADDKLGARVEREAAQMAAQAEEDDYLQEQLNRPPPPEVAAAIKDAQEVYIADINRQLAEGKARAAKDDLEDSLVQAEAENRNGEGFEEGEVYNADARPPQRTVAEFFAARDAKSPESDAPYAPRKASRGSWTRPLQRNKCGCAMFAATGLGFERSASSDSTSAKKSISKMHPANSRSPAK